MIRMKFVCKRCGYKFETEVFENGEAEEERKIAYTVRCPKCRGYVEKE
ncbi:MAG: hypothetical protein WC301_06010 [Candidatus Omnitrophota bacterium]